MAAASTTKQEDAGKVEAPVETSGPANQSNLPEEERPPGDLRRRTGKTRRKGPFVKYVGSAAARSIDHIAWKSLNIELKTDEQKSTHVWSVENDKMIEDSKFSDAQLDYLLIDDLQQGTGTHAFLLVDYDDSDPPQLIQVSYE